MTKRVYGIGYSGRSLDDLRRIVEVLDAYLVDIRFAPFSRNRNYKGGPVDIVDYAAGKAAVEAMDKPALLMCMCKDPATCHRTHIMQRLAVDGFEVHEWNDNGTQQ